MLKKAIAWQSSLSLVNMLCGIIQLVILARLLEPDEFGILAIILVTISLSKVFSDLGMANYIVHRQVNSEVLNSTLFWLCAFSSFILFSLLYLSANALSDLYESEEVAEPLKIAALSLIPIGLTAQLQAQLTRELRLDLLAKIEILTRILATVTTIALAYMEFGVYSVVLGTLLYNTVRSIFIWGCSGKECRPSFQFSYVEAKLAWSFGVYQIGSQLINQIRQNIDVLFLGFYLSTSGLGYYSLAKQLISKPTDLILPVARKVTMPLFAKIQGSKIEITKLLERANDLIAILLIFPYCLLMFYKESIVDLFYGMGYSDVYIYITPLAIFWVLRSIGGAFAGPLMQALGKTKIDFYWNLFTLIGLSIICALTSIRGGVVLAYSLVLYQMALFVIVFYVFYKKRTTLTLINFVMPVIKYSLFSLGVLLFFGGVLKYFNFKYSWIEISLISVFILPVYFFYIKSLLKVPTPKC